jgi:hypothetical protein
MLRGPSSSAPLLTAFNATNLAIIYSSNQAVGNRDTVGPVAHFATPTIANGRVYLGTTTKLLIYGLMPRIKNNGGSNQTGKVGTTLPHPISVKVVDAYSGAPISGLTVHLSDGGAGGSFANPAPVTASNGVAASKYTLPGNPGVVSITVTATGYVSPTPYKETAQ